MFKIILSCLICLASTSAYATSIGIKYNYALSRYNKAAYKDIDLLASYGIKDVMFSLPWSHMADGEGKFDRATYEGKILPVLRYASKKGISVALSVHNSFWANKKRWGLPEKYMKLPGKKNLLQNDDFYHAYLDFIKDLSAQACSGSSLAYINVINEPFPLTKRYSQVLVDRTMEVVDAANARCHEKVISGVVSGQLDYARGTIGPNKALSAIWRKQGIVSAQREDLLWLSYSDPQLAPLRRVRTEGFVNEGLIGARSGGRYYSWSSTERTPLYGSYKVAYDLEGDQQKGGRVDTAYVWRVGSPNGQPTLLDGRNRPTPYLLAVADLNSGISRVAFDLDRDMWSGCKFLDEGAGVSLTLSATPCKRRFISEHWHKPAGSKPKTATLIFELEAASEGELAVKIGDFLSTKITLKSGPNVVRKNVDNSTFEAMIAAKKSELSITGERAKIHDLKVYWDTGSQHE